MRLPLSSALFAFILVGLATTAAHGQAVTANRDSAAATPANATAADSAAAASDSLVVSGTSFVASPSQQHHRSLLARAAARAGAALGQSKAMMVVGLGGLIVGAIIGGTPGTIIMVGGAVVGLVGLYNYLQ